MISDILLIYFSRVGVFVSGKASSLNEQQDFVMFSV